MKSEWDAIYTMDWTAAITVAGHTTLAVAVAPTTANLAACSHCHTGSRHSRPIKQYYQVFAGIH